MDCFTLSGFAMTLQNNPERIQFAQGTLRPCNPRTMASNCLILVAEIVEVSSRGQEQNSTSSPHPAQAHAFLKTKKAWS
ncbi:hypothetical protein, partial [uncultured Fibrobacter sp.]|uniref:hypothetical protein n=1 Tax=uncultured Fibrobacter sp. TaxID=261512 RepID=UPI0025976858